jgi:hypothetical protein
MTDPAKLIAIAEDLLAALAEMEHSGYSGESLSRARTLNAALAPAYERLRYGTSPIHTSRMAPYLWFPPWREKVENTLAALKAGHPAFEDEDSHVADGYDTAQICRNGHVVNSLSARMPQFNEAFCTKCGAATMTACEDCGVAIRGYYWVPGVIGGSTDIEMPRFCHACGRSHPWTTASVETARELARDDEKLDDEDRALLERSFDDIIRETPATSVAANRMKRILAKAGKGTAEGLREVLVSIASETAKKSMGL